MRKSTKRSVVIASTALVAVAAVGGVALAGGWLIGGKGTASAAGAKAEAMTADVQLKGSAYPGVKLIAEAKVDNPNEFPVVLSGVKNFALKSATKGGGTNAACATDLGNAGLNAIVPDLPQAAPVIPDGAKNYLVKLPVTITDAFPVSCADTLISVTFDFEGHSTTKAPAPVSTRG